MSTNYKGRNAPARPGLVGPLARLSPEAQARFDAAAEGRGIGPLGVAIGIGDATVEKLRYGGRASAPAVAKVEAFFAVRRTA